METEERGRESTQIAPNTAQTQSQNLRIEGMFVVSTEELLLDYSVIRQSLGG